MVARGSAPRLRWEGAAGFWCALALPRRRSRYRINISHPRAGGGTIEAKEAWSKVSAWEGAHEDTRHEDGAARMWRRGLRPDVPVMAYPSSRSAGEIEGAPEARDFPGAGALAPLAMSASKLVTGSRSLVF